ncbi:MAG TPA: hypothetical protein VLV31_13550 [Candidatus Acidoferrales bacterium]|nr:hypothetical protein [Candidatus Acidoferrales bacterium]
MPKKRNRAICIIRIAQSADLSKLERARVTVSKLKGIVTSEADHALQVLTVEYDHETISMEDIRRAVMRV